MDTDTNPISLKLNKPFSSSEPTIVLRGLVNAGEYQFQLVVMDQVGNSSPPTTVSIIVAPPLSFWSKLQCLFYKFVKLSLQFNRS